MGQEKLKELPIGRQTFSELIEEDLLYVDKTRYVWDLVREGKYYFLSRPRRFGKSLLLSTLKSFFEGREDLFKGLFIHDKVKEWKKYPVVYIDYSLVDYKNGKANFNKSLLNFLHSIASNYELEINKDLVYDFFYELIQQLHHQYGKVVVLIDEYDKPMIDMLTKEKLFEENRDILRGLYASLKGLDPYLRFVMLTGVSRFSKVGVFSGLNNLNDISLTEGMSCIVGFNQKELQQYFAAYLRGLKLRYNCSEEKLLLDIKQYYNGFSWDGLQKLYNPFSILKFMKDQRFDNYWFSTGTPTFLIDIAKKQKALPEALENIVATDLEGYSADATNIPLPAILFQTGYLTIKEIGFDGIATYYRLGYPNREVRDSFTTFLLAAFMQKDEFFVQPASINLRKALRDQDIERFLKIIRTYLAEIPYQLHIPKEAYYHSLIFMLLRLMGLKMDLEKATDKGRIDGVLELPNQIYIIEFKFATNKRIKRVKTLSRQALKQIEDKKYYEAYLSGHKKIILLGVGFLNKQLDGKSKELLVTM